MKMFMPGRKADEQTKSRRMGLREQNNLGIVSVFNGSKVGQVYRNNDLNLYDSYYENCQYDHLKEWSDPDKKLRVRDKKPRIKFGLARSLSSKVVAKIVGDSVFPKFTIEDSPDDQEFIRSVIKSSRLKTHLIEPLRRAVNTGSVFVRFKIVDGSYQLSWYNSKFCYPTFSESDELKSLVIKYIYEDPTEKDVNGNPVKKWYKLELGADKDTLFDNPVYNANAESEPVFQIVSEFEHNFGFVQGEWITTSENQDEIDGYSLVQDITEFIDELNYSLSQSSRAVEYNQDPQLVFKNVDEDEAANLIKSVTKSWNLGREGEAAYLESSLDGVQTAITLREKVIGNIGDLTRVAFLNPEKIVAQAQSARAMEILNEPLIELIDEYRGLFEIHLISLITKLALATLLAKAMGIDVPIEIPDGYTPKSLAIDCNWPPIFRQTLEDLQKKVGLAVSASTANIISRKTATKYVADDFGIEDVDAEIAEIAAQPIFNPFGGGFGGGI